MSASTAKTNLNYSPAMFDSSHVFRLVITTFGETLKSASETVKLPDYRCGVDHLPICHRDETSWEMETGFH